MGGGDGTGLGGSGLFGGPPAGEADMGGSV